MRKNGSEIIAECLLEQGVDTVFGYPGGAVLNIYDALYQYRDRITHILTAHEQGAAHAADGYARSTGKVGVVIATSGPGATNLVTGIATAYMDSVPMVAITGNVNVDLLGRDSFQEVDIQGITMPVTKHNFIVKDVGELAGVIRRAFQIANSGRKGPVLIDIPKDITSAVTEYEPRQKLPVFKGGNPEPSACRKAAELIAASKRPIIYAGGGVISSGASQELLRLAEKFQIPVCCSIMGLGGFPASHPLFIGNIGMHGSFQTGMAVDNSDLILTAGARFSDRVAGDRKKFGEGAVIIQLDIDPAEINKNVYVQHSVVGDLKESLEKIAEEGCPMEHEKWLQEISGWKNVGVVKEQKDSYPHPLKVIQAVQRCLNQDDIIATDVGQHQMWTAQTYRFEKPRTFLTSGGLGTMGFGLGAAIGAQVAHPERRVVLISGDGSFHMNLNELTTLASYELPVVVIVMNNSVLGMVRQWQKLFYGGRFSQTDPHRKTDFVKLAEAFGVTGMRITRPEEVDDVVQRALELKKPVVVDCQISPDENVLPMIPPGASVDRIITEM